MHRMWRRLNLLVVFVIVMMLCNFGYISFYSRPLIVSPQDDTWREEAARKEYVHERDTIPQEVLVPTSSDLQSPHLSENTQSNIKSTDTFTRKLPAQANNAMLKDFQHNAVRKREASVPPVAMVVRRKQLDSSKAPVAPFLRDIAAPKQGTTKAYMLADDYWEQQSSGSRNLHLLQCWAGQLNLSVVEPFMQDSSLRTHLTSLHPLNKQGQPELRFGDLFDLQAWNKDSRELGYAGLEPWEDFLTNSPKDIITVQFKYAYSDEVRANKNRLRQNPLIDLKSRYTTGCLKGWPKEQQIQFLRSQNFRIVRDVCFNFEYGDFLTSDEFFRHIYAHYAPRNVTVVFKQWRGTGGIGRVLVKESLCHNAFTQEHIAPSRRLISDAQSYIQKYLSDRNNNYIAIMARLEKSKITLRRDGIVGYCLNKIISYWENLRADSGLNTTFLSIDIGKYGSNSFRNTGDKSDLSTEFKRFFTKLYNSSSSISSWEHGFEEISRSVDAGYIALLQKAIVTRAKCVIFVGGGSFQKHALHLYQTLHPTQERCIHIVKECTLPKNLPL